MLMCTIGELTLLPVIENDRAFSLPFQLAFGSGTIRAQLVLVDRDPLPLEISEDVALEDAVIGWTNALIGFADVTCIHLDSPATRALPEHRPTATSAASVPSPRRAPRIRQRRHPWPSPLVPVGRWASYSGSLVAGHRRRLATGRTASDEPTNAPARSESRSGQMRPGYDHTHAASLTPLKCASNGTDPTNSAFTCQYPGRFRKRQCKGRASPGSIECWPRPAQPAGFRRSRCDGRL